MKRQITQEWFKIKQQKLLIYSIGALVVLMIYSFLTIKSPQRLVSTGYGATQWIIIIITAVASYFLAMEYNNRTILMMFYKSSNKLLLYFSKFINVVLFGLLLIFVGILLSTVINLFQQINPLSQQFLLNLVGTFIYLIYMVSLSFLLYSLTKRNVITITVCMLVGFFGAPLSNALTTSQPILKGIIRWNPLNMIYVTNQISDKQFMQFSSLSIIQLIIGTIIYSIIFFWIGYYLFKKRAI